MRSLHESPLSCTALDGNALFPDLLVEALTPSQNVFGDRNLMKEGIQSK